MKVCILGAGSLGSAIGGTLALAGNEVHLVARPAHCEAMNERGLVLVTPDGESVASVHGHTDKQDIGVCDLVIVLCKTYDTQEVIQGADVLVGPDTMVLSLQNGLGAEDVLVEAFGQEHVIGGKTYVGGMLLEPGRVQSTTKGKQTFIGEMDGTMSQRVAEVVSVFNEAGLPTQQSDNILGVIWNKLLVNVSTGAVCAITGLPYGDVYQMPQVEKVALDAVQEGIDVAKAQGISLASDDPRYSWELAREGLPYDFKPSLLQSLEKKRPSEVDYIAGAVVREGAKCGVDTPTNAILVAMVQGIERRIREYGA